jgi:hypothetical protein
VRRETSAVEEPRAGQSLAERIEAPNLNVAANNPEDLEIPSFEYPASDEMDTDGELNRECLQFVLT